MAMVCGLLLPLALTAPIGHGLRLLAVLVIPLLFLLCLVAG